MACCGPRILGLSIDFALTGTVLVRVRVVLQRYIAADFDFAVLCAGRLDGMTIQIQRDIRADLQTSRADIYIFQQVDCLAAFRRFDCF